MHCIACYAMGEQFIMRQGCLTTSDLVFFLLNIQWTKIQSLFLDECATDKRAKAREFFAETNIDKNRE
jgi:hypothetical protein